MIYPRDRLVFYVGHWEKWLRSSNSNSLLGEDIGFNSLVWASPKSSGGTSSLVLEISNYSGRPYYTTNYLFSSNNLDRHSELERTLSRGSFRYSLLRLLRTVDEASSSISELIYFSQRWWDLHRDARRSTLRPEDDRESWLYLLSAHRQS